MAHDNVYHKDRIAGKRMYIAALFMKYLDKTVNSSQKLLVA
jgi:hypothetical protein